MLLAAAAATADTATPWPVHEHVVADGDAGGTRAEARDGTGDLVAERERQVVGERARGPVHQVQVGVAQARAAHAQQHLARPRRRLLHLAQVRPLAPLGQADCSHSAHNFTNLNSGW